MHCPNCKAPIHPSEARCLQCGAERPPRRVFGAAPKEFALTGEEDSFEVGDVAETNDWSFPFERRVETERHFEKAEQQPYPKLERPLEPKTRWGGFLRRGFAFVVDLIVVIALSTLMGLLSLIGYKVGLTGSGRSLTRASAIPLLAMVMCGWMVLATAYFVIFHGGDGKTIGKWLLGLRVVGPEQSAISYRRALLRWVGMLAFAPLILGFLWVLWSREKRGWHDFLAGTWVIRER